MKLNFCCACGSQEDLHQHHIIPTSLSGMKRSETNLEDTITLCYNHHRMIHGVQNGQINHSELVLHYDIFVQLVYLQRSHFSNMNGKRRYGICFL